MLRSAPIAVLLAALLALGASGCGTSDAEKAPQRAAVLMLDSAPSAVHSGIYTALSRGYTDGLSLRLEVQVPATNADPVRRLAGGDVDFAVLDVNDLALAREGGAEIVGVMAIVQAPLAALVAPARVRSPAQLGGRAVGVGGRPADRALVRSMIREAGGDPAGTRFTRVGVRAVAAVRSGTVAAATGSRVVEGAALRAAEPGAKVFGVGEIGAPPYPELVLAARRETLDDEPGLVRAAVRSLQRGYEEVLVDPETGAQSIGEYVEDTDRAALLAQLDALTPAFKAQARDFGELSKARLQAWADWAVKVRLVNEPVRIALAFDGRYVSGEGRGF